MRRGLLVYRTGMLVATAQLIRTIQKSVRLGALLRLLAISRRGSSGRGRRRKMRRPPCSPHSEFMHAPMETVVALSSSSYWSSAHAEYHGVEHWIHHGWHLVVLVLVLLLYWGGTRIPHACVAPHFVGRLRRLMEALCAGGPPEISLLLQELCNVHCGLVHR
jgi:hypothetical protein